MGDNGRQVFTGGRNTRTRFGVAYSGRGSPSSGTIKHPH
jgi:hypothetical protein